MCQFASHYDKSKGIHLTGKLLIWIMLLSPPHPFAHGSSSIYTILLNKYRLLNNRVVAALFNVNSETVNFGLTTEKVLCVLD